MRNQVVSIIIPVYNVENYINRCLNSVLSQSYKLLEIILVDDGSTDSSGAICDDFAKKDSRIKILHKFNEGQGVARNCGLRIASGEYIMFVDSDDVIHHDMVLKMVDNLHKTNSEISICGRQRFSTELCDFDSQNPIKDLYEYTGRDATINLFEVNKLIKPALWDKLYKRELFIGLEFPPIVFEDAAVIYKLLLRASRVCVSTERLYGYYIRPNSTITMPWDKKKYNAFVDVVSQMKEFFIKKGDKDLLYAYYVYFFMFSIEAWCRSQNSDKLSNEDKNDILKNMGKTATIANLKKLKIRFRKKIMFFMFPYTPKLLCYLLSIKF